MQFPQLSNIFSTSKETALLEKMELVEFRRQNTENVISTLRPLFATHCMLCVLNNEVQFTSEEFHLFVKEGLMRHIGTFPPTNGQAERMVHTTAAHH